MIAAAGEEADRAGVANVRWVRVRAEDLPAGLGMFDVVTLAQSFHWLDRAPVAATARTMLTPGGALVHVQATTDRGDRSVDPLAHPRPPWAEISDLARRYLGPVRRAGRGYLPDGTPSGEAEVLRAAGFDGPERIDLDTAEVVTRTGDEIVAAVFSLSSVTPHLLGADREPFEADLRRLLRRAAPDGLFAERTRDAALDVWRPR
jgi:methyltransferase family protein